jgi:hypothetical protein
MTEPKARRATEEEAAAIAEYAKPLVEVIMALPGQFGLHVLCFAAAELVLTAHTTIPKVEAWDHIAATIRKTIDDNVKRGLQ